jgi:DNA polymerase-4
VLATARELLGAAAPLIRQRGITLIGLSFGNLHDDDAIQLSLPLDHRATGALDAALDGVKERFGAKAVGRAVLLGRRAGISVPLLPDDDLSA